MNQAPLLVIFGTILPAVLPVLPAAAGLLTALVTGLLGAVLAAATLRPGATRVLARAIARQWRGLLVLALLGGAAAQVGALFRTREFNVSRLPATSAAQWPMFRGTLDRTGHADDVAGPSAGGVQWTGGRGFEFLSSAAVVGEQVVAVGCRGDTARFFGWDAETGDLAWTVAPPGYRATFSSPVTADHWLFCGEGLHWTPDSRVLCVDLRRPGEPDAVTAFSTRSHVECTPVLAGGRIYVNAGDDGIYCLAREATGMRCVWHVDGEQYADAETSLAVQEGRVYVGLGVGGEALCLLDAGTGAELARRDLRLPVFSPPAIVDGRIYLGLGRANYVDEADATPGEVCCLDAETLQIVWKAPAPGAVLAAIAVNGGDVFFNTVDGHLLVVDGHGNERGRWRAAARLLTAPAVTERMIYCLANDGVLTGLDRRQLQPVWSVRLGRPGRYISSPVVFRGRVYVGTPEDGLVCVGEAPQPAGEDRWRAGLGGPGRAGAGDTSSIPDSVAVAWTFSGTDPQQRAEVTAPPAVTRRELVVPLASRDWSGLTCAEPQGVGVPRVRWRFDSAAPIRISPVISASTIVCLCGEPGAGGELVALERSSGTVVGRQSVERVSNTLAADRDSVFLADGVRRLTRYNLALQRIWQVDVERLEWPLDVRDDLIAAAAVEPSRLMTLDRVTGRTLWQRDLPATPVDSAVISRQRIVVPTSEGVELHSLLDGSFDASATEWSASAPVFVDVDQIVATTTSGEIVIASGQSGRAQYRVPGARAGVSPLVTANAIVFATDDDHLLRIPRGNERLAQEWFDTSPFGPITQPPILCNGQVFICVSGAGVVCLGAPGP